MAHININQAYAENLAHYEHKHSVIYYDLYFIL